MERAYTVTEIEAIRRAERERTVHAIFGPNDPKGSAFLMALENEPAFLGRRRDALNGSS